MASQTEKPEPIKISRQFKARLARLGPEQKVRAVVMLATEGADIAARPSRANRQAIQAAIRQATATALPEIDRLLKQHGGKRLAAYANALGGIPIETTATGIDALAASKQVKVILEDQAISLHP
jgi:hypothetical protein